MIISGYMSKIVFSVADDLEIKDVESVTDDSTSMKLRQEGTHCSFDCNVSVFISGKHS